jgi:hypothetical protein
MKHTYNCMDPSDTVQETLHLFFTPPVSGICVLYILSQFHGMLKLLIINA